MDYATVSTLTSLFTGALFVGLILGLEGLHK